MLPYPEKRYHLAARRELEQKTTTLEHVYYIYPGMSMGYFGLPRGQGSLRPLRFFIDPEQGQAVLPGDGEARISMTYTTDAGRYTALALDLEIWPRRVLSPDHGGDHRVAERARGARGEEPGSQARCALPAGRDPALA